MIGGDASDSDTRRRLRDIRSRTRNRGDRTRMGQLFYLSDRRWAPTIQQNWQEGLASRSPADASDATVDEFRACARRLGKRLGCRVTTEARNGCGIAVANDGFPLGMVDMDERERWLADAAAAAPYRAPNDDDAIGG